MIDHGCENFQNCLLPIPLKCGHYEMYTLLVGFLYLGPCPFWNYLVSETWATEHSRSHVGPNEFSRPEMCKFHDCAYNTEYEIL